MAAETVLLSREQMYGAKLTDMQGFADDARDSYDAITIPAQLEFPIVMIAPPTMINRSASNQCIPTSFKDGGSNKNDQGCR